MRLIGLGRLKPGILEKLDGLGYKIVFLGWALNVIGWAILGLSYWAVLRALGAASGNPLAQLHLYTAGGLAGRGGRLRVVRPRRRRGPRGRARRVHGAAPGVGDAVALAAAVLLRLAWLAAELVAAGVLSLSTMRTRSVASENQEPEV